MTPLDKPLKRALNINGRDYVITFDPQVLKITEKGRRIGLQLKWTEMVSGETALAVALHASVGKFPSATKTAAPAATSAPAATAPAPPTAPAKAAPVARGKKARKVKRSP